MPPSEHTLVLEFEVVAKLDKLDAVNAQFEVENECVNLDLVIV